MPASTTAPAPRPRAALMATAVTRRNGRVIVAESLHPEYRQVLATYLRYHDAELVTIPAPEGNGFR